MKAASKILCLLLPLAFVLTSLTRAAEINVFAAASLSDALEKIATNYKGLHPSDTLRFNFAASSTLSRQIREGAPADIFLSADEAQMDALASRDLIESDTRRTLLSNTLVIVVSARNDAPAIQAPGDLLSRAIKHLALGETSTVPAGVYARAWLTRIELWEKLSASGKIVPCENVRAALAAVESGNADAAVVYGSDALSSKKVRVSFQIPVAETPLIAYPIAIMKNSKEQNATRAFAAYLATSHAMEIFAQHGFLPPPTRTRPSEAAPSASAKNATPTN